MADSEEELKTMGYQIFDKNLTDEESENEQEDPPHLTWFIIFLLVLPPLLPFGGCLYILIEVCNDQLEQFLVGLFLCFLLGLIIQVMRLLAITTEDSISGMVAQRFNRESYLSILLITGMSFYTSGFILGGAIARVRNDKSNDNVSVIFATLSPILTFLILIFPLTVDKTKAQLTFRPEQKNYANVIKKIFSNNAKIEFAHQMRFYRNWTPLTHERMHFAVIVIGLIFGYYSIIGHMVNVKNKNTFKFAVEFIFCLVSAFFLLLFITFYKVKTCFKYCCTCKCCLGVHRCRLYFEFIGLFCFLVELIYVSIVAGDLISDF